MKQANHQRAVEMCKYMAATPAVTQTRPESASQPSTMMSATAFASQPESSASARAATHGPSMPFIPALPQWHQAAIMNQSSQDAAKKRRQELMQDRTNKRQNTGMQAASQPAAGSKNPGGKGTVKMCGACGKPKAGHPKGSCPTHCMGCKEKKQNGSQQDRLCQACKAEAA